MGLTRLVDPADMRVLTAQLQSADSVGLLRLAMNVFGLLFLWRVFGHHVSLTIMVGWSGALIGVVGVSALLIYRRQKGRNIAPQARDLRRHGLTGLLHGLVWAACMLMFSRGEHAEHLIALWTLISCIMVCGAISYAATPLAAIAFLMPCIVGVSAMFDGGSQLPLRALATSYALSLLVGCLIYARTFARQHSTTLQLAEKSEVVSLLLREYEQGASDWLWQTDALRRISSVSARFAETLGRAPQELEGAALVQILAGPAWESGRFSIALHGLADHLKRRESFSNLMLPVDINGRLRWLELSASPRYDEHGVFQGFRGVGSDVTAQRESADKIAQLARFDALTGLPNRAHLREALDQAIVDAAGRRPGCAFLMLDLDRFKAINDSLGHQVGDQLLSQVAQRLRQVCNGVGFAGRIGGDEFGVVIPQITDERVVARLSGAIIESLSAAYQIDQHVLHVGASVGSALSPGDGHQSEALTRSADLALYRAKDEGGGVHCAYEPHLHAMAEERQRLEQALREALDKDQLHIVYQPVVDAASSAVTGFEALARWTHPELGPISPAKFVPVAEEARLIGPIGEWVLRNACLEAMRWPSDVRVAVNVSAEQLHQSNFVAAVESALAQSGLKAHRLELEVTESVFMQEDTGALRVLDQLQSLGVQLSLDDFGTGYSSLGYLSRTRFNTIKIDRSFVVGAAHNTPESLAIIRAVVTLAESLGMATTAEGVETASELEMVRSLGCRKVQGYYFGRPMLPQDAVRLFPQPPVYANA